MCEIKFPEINLLALKQLDYTYVKWELSWSKNWSKSCDRIMDSALSSYVTSALYLAKTHQQAT